MTLFDDTELFTIGGSPKKYFDLPDMELMHYDGFIPKEEADTYYTGYYPIRPGGNTRCRCTTKWSHPHG